MRTWPLAGVVALAGGLAVTSCGSGSSPATGSSAPPQLTKDVEMNPGACAACHPNAYREWSGSMHAYAGEDPVFRAMNRRGQRETNGTLGSFCVNCHAPLAVRTGATKDGTNLDSVPPQLRGVTCFFCHSVTSFQGPLHNNPLVLGDDRSLRAGIADPVLDKAPHPAEFSGMLSQNNDASTPLCGSCHDIVSPPGAAIERTFDEWKHSKFGLEGTGNHKTNCGSCHMKGRTDYAAQVPGGAPLRTVHDHSMAAVDVALTPFAQMDAQHAGVQSFLDSAIKANLCVRPAADGVEVEVDLTNDTVGHNWPSGSNQDRRAWVVLEAFRDGARVFSLGDVPDGVAAATALAGSPDALFFHDTMFDANGAETHKFWEAARYESTQLPAAVTSNPTSPGFDHTVRRTYSLFGLPPDEVRMRLRIRPIDVDVVQDLVATGDLDPAIADKLTTFTLAATDLHWSMSAGGFGCVP